MDTTQNAITERIIGSAIRVHQALGTGLAESAYQAALAIEFECVRVRFQSQVAVAAHYKGQPIGHYRIDFLVEDLVIVEIKAVETVHPVVESQILTYLRVTKLNLALLINFNRPRLVDGVRRFVL